MKKFFLTLLPLLKSYKLQLFYVVFGGIIVGGSVASLAYFIRPVLDDIFIAENLDALYFLPFFVILIYLAKGFGKFIQVYNTARISEGIISTLRIDILKHIVYLDLKFFYTYASGDIISRFSNDITNIRGFFTAYLADSVKDLITIFALLGVIIYNSYEMAFYALIIIPACVYPLSKLSTKIKRISHQSQSTLADLTSRMTEIINNYETIKSYIAEKKEISSFAKTSNKARDMAVQEEKTNAMVSPVMEIVSSIGVAFVIISGGQYVIDGDMSVGAFFSFMTALFMLYEPIKRLTVHYNKMSSISASFERVIELLEAKSDIIDGNAKIQTIENIKFENVFLRYKIKDILKNINIEIKKGESIALIGSSGGGKTSFVNLINRFLDVSQGTLSINNQNIKEIQQSSLREKIALVSQRIFIFNDTVTNNICYSSPFNEDKLKNAISLANAEFVYDLENGLETKLDEFGTNISGGQRQRISIARAIYKNPDVYIFDEATSALDGDSESIIKNSIKNLSKNKIVLIIAHRLSSITHSDKIMIFDNGNIVDFGESKCIRENSSYFKKILDKID